MSDTVVIDERYVGPPGSANGGYACGTTAAPLGERLVEVTLRLPPPVGRALDLDVEAGRATLRDGEAVVAEAVVLPGDLDLDLPEPPGPDEVAATVERFDADDYLARHPFPGCFTCGPARAESDGLRVFPGALDRNLPMVAWPWTPAPSVVADDGLVEVPVVWAALDCPSGLVRAADEDGGELSVLGKMATSIARRPEAGETLVVAGWTVGHEGRRRFAGSAVWAAGGEVLARCRATWVVLSEEQARAFGAVS